MTFYVNVREVWIQSYRVEADSKLEAIMKVESGSEEAFVTGSIEFSHRLNSNTWTADAE